MKEVEQWRHVLVLKSDEGDTLHFAFQAKMWAGITFAIAAALYAGGYFFWKSHGAPLLPIILAAFASLLVYSSLYSLTAHRSLEIRSSTKTVKYIDKNLYKQIAWEKPFSEFEKVWLYHARSGRNSLPAKNITIELVAKDGRFFRVGVGEFGAFKSSRAEQLADRIARPMGIAVVNDLKKHRQHLR